MCGRYSLGTPAVKLAERFQLDQVPTWTPRYNIAPTQDVLAVLRSQESLTRSPRVFRWGLIPAWAKDLRIGSRLINARAETVATKPVFRRAFRERRCLILGDGFFEWQRQARRKQPFYIRLRDGQPFAFAGLWERWISSDGEPLDSCTIITTEANDLIKSLHVRMPVLLPPGDHDVWLDPSVREVERLQPLLRPYAADEMMAYPVSAQVNSPVNDSSECVEPLP